MAQVTGLKRVPRVVVDPSAASTGAAVFGRNRRPTVCLHAGLLAGRATAPEDFEAVLLHELAHIRNGDVTLTYATIALWRTFIAAVSFLTRWASESSSSTRTPRKRRPTRSRFLGGVPSSSRLP
ncbi:M48 family metalloprotease [Streptomyces sp. ID38640]|nr:M48 family metalloprotease [Streptomyces sp. ID38640]